ncbi:hypothetical protein [Bizionia psychrotolerans]|uniref:hypothetical protein n=1 Tax=Bizionia psychrotolerans TaxID=1492901 RepID=UPI0006516499|nr:hypothetical protein [Bizionia psychrotolerans]
MHGSLSQFKAAQERKKSRDSKRRKTFENGNQAFTGSDDKAEYDFPELSESEMEILKSDIRNKLQADKRKERIIVFCIVVVVAFVIVYFA